MTCEEARAAIRSRQPLLHCISNIVTANDCANLALAVGGKPHHGSGPAGDGRDCRPGRRRGAEHRHPR